MFVSVGVEIGMVYLSWAIFCGLALASIALFDRWTAGPEGGIEKAAST